MHKAAITMVAHITRGKALLDAGQAFLLQHASAAISCLNS
jgi:hypothetical protein